MKAVLHYVEQVADFRAPACSLRADASALTNPFVALDHAVRDTATIRLTDAGAQHRHRDRELGAPETAAALLNQSVAAS